MLSVMLRLWRPEPSRTSTIDCSNRLRKRTYKNSAACNTRCTCLCRCLLVAGCAVELPRKEQSTDLLGLQCRVALVGRQKIVLDRIGGAQHLDRAQACQGQSRDGGSARLQIELKMIKISRTLRISILCCYQAGLVTAAGRRCRMHAACIHRSIARANFSAG